MSSVFGRTMRLPGVNIHLQQGLNNEECAWFETAPFLALLYPHSNANRPLTQSSHRALHWLVIATWMSSARCRRVVYSPATENVQFCLIWYVGSCNTKAWQTGGQICLGEINDEWDVCVDGGWGWQKQRLMLDWGSRVTTQDALNPLWIRMLLECVLANRTVKWMDFLRYLFPTVYIIIWP